MYVGLLCLEMTCRSGHSYSYTSKGLSFLIEGNIRKPVCMYVHVTFGVSFKVSKSFPVVTSCQMLRKETLDMATSERKVIKLQLYKDFFVCF